MVDKPERPDRRADGTPSPSAAGPDCAADEPRRSDETRHDETHPVDGRRQADSGIRDIASLQADDALLDALGGRDTHRAAELDDSELNALLLAWRREVDSEPIPELVDVETATATIAAAREAPARRKRRLWVPVASAAAVLAIAFGGVSLAAKDAHPGDTLWGLTRVLYTDHARSVMAAADIRDDFGVARKEIASGDYAGARSALVRAQRAMQVVQGDDGRADLQATQKSLLEQVKNSTPPVGGGRGGTGQGDRGGRVVPAPADSSSASEIPTMPATTTPAPTSGSSAPPQTTPPSTPPSHPAPPSSTSGKPSPGTHTGHVTTSTKPSPGPGTHTGHVTTSTSSAPTPHAGTSTDTGGPSRHGATGSSTSGSAGTVGATGVTDSGTPTAAS